MPFFSVIIPTYNRADLIAETLDSVFAQTFKDYEIIVVDDGSTDSTPKVLAEYKGRITILHQPNQGQAVARHTGTQHAKGKYIAFLDSDDLWFPWTLSTFHQTILEHNSPACVMGAPAHFHKIEQLDSVKNTTIKTRLFRDFIEASCQREVTFYGTGAVVIKAQLLLSVGKSPNHRYNAEDLDLFLRLGTTPGYVQIEQPVTVGYRQHPNNDTKNLASTARGLLLLMQNEINNQYPGSTTRRKERQAFISRLGRHWTFRFLQNKHYSLAWSFYARSFTFQMRAGRLRYLSAFPFLAVWSAIKAR